MRYIYVNAVAIDDKANYIATDTDGEMWWYECMPVLPQGDKYWQSGDGGYELVYAGLPPKDPRATLMAYNEETDEYESIS